MWQFAVVMLVILVFTLALISGLKALGGESGDPEEILKGRFARGEIDEAEYARRLAILRYGPPLELPD